ncbi:MAG TPA: hypothetical protein VD884_09770 [Ohtaekwangia sp.]|nr:hypothetical protein [Ohtaekwangia sp.]
MSKKLNDPTLPLNLDAVVLDNPSLVSEALEDDTINFVFGADSKLNVSLFNAEIDADMDEVFGGKEALIPFNPANAWLKYEGDANIKLSSGGAIRSIGFDVDAKAGLKSYVYRIHSASEQVAKAIADDISPLKTIFSRDDIKGLKNNEAVALQFYGAITTLLEVSWSDVWSTGFSTLTGLLDNAELVKLKFGPEVSVKAKVKVEDNFKVLIVKKDHEKYWVRLKRDYANSRSVGAALSVAVSIENPKVVISQIETIFKDILEVSYGQLEKIAAKTEDALLPADVIVIRALADRLGWQKGDLFARLQKELEDLKEKWIEKIAAAVNTKIKAGFSYAYLRVREKEDVFSASLTSKAIDKFYFDLLKGNVGKLTDFHIKNPASSLLNDVTFLMKDVRKRERSWGFSLGVGDFVASDNHKVALRTVQRKTEKGQQISYEGRRTYEETLGKEKVSWKIDFNASMPLVSNYATPLASEFDYSLYLNFEWQSKKFRSEDLTRFLDLCRTWNIINEGQFLSLRETLSADLKGAKDLTFSCHCTYPSTLFKAIIMGMGNDKVAIDDVWYSGLAAALPYWEPFTVRMQPDIRARYYAGIWKEFLETESVLPHEIAYQRLKKVDKKLAEQEYDYRPNGFINFKSFAFIANANPQAFRRWKAFREGMSLLKEAIDQKAMQRHTPVIEKAFEKLEDLWFFSHHVIAFGNLLTRVGMDIPIQFREASLAGEIQYELHEKQTIMLGKSS